MAVRVMGAADQHDKNQQLSVNELRTWLPDDPFMLWLTGTRHRRGQMVRYDTNMDGAIDLDELTCACRDFLIETEQRNASSDDSWIPDPVSRHHTVFRM